LSIFIQILRIVGTRVPKRTKKDQKGPKVKMFGENWASDVNGGTKGAESGVREREERERERTGREGMERRERAESEREGEREGERRVRGRRGVHG
jgi:hypothetical protein